MEWTNVAVLSIECHGGALRGEEASHALVVARSQLSDTVSAGLRKASYDVAASPPTTSGVLVLSVGGKRRRFQMVLSDLCPVYVCEIVETRTLREWLTRAPRNPEFEAAFQVICDSLRSDARVLDVLAFSGPKAQGKSFVEEAIEKLERALGIYSR